jgi:hypothetical protein
MYDEAGTTFGGPSGGGITSALILEEDGGSFGDGPGGYDEAGTTITTAQLNNIGPTQFGDSFVDRTKDYLGQTSNCI